MTIRNIESLYPWRLPRRSPNPVEFCVALQSGVVNLARIMTNFVLSVFTLVFGGTIILNANETWWPQFRGPNAAGISPSAEPPIRFGPGTNQLWKVVIPPGSSSPCIWDDRIFLTTFDDGRLWTQCVQRNDGSLLWKRDAKAEQLEEFHPTEGSPAASTPATDGVRVVSYFGSCGLMCHDLEGNELWRYTMGPATTSGSFGSGGSPFIAKGHVFVNRDQASGSSLLAVDLRTGKKVWQTARPDVQQSFGTPIYWNNNGADEIVMSGAIKLKAYDLKTGKERWSLGGMPAFTCTTPVLGEGMLYFAGWSPSKADGQIPTFEQLAKGADANNDGTITLDESKAAGSDAWFNAMDADANGVLTSKDIELMLEAVARGRNVLLAVKAGGKGELSDENVAWTQTRGLPYVPSPLYYDGRIYLIKDGGMCSSFNAKTGEAYYQQERLGTRGSYYASPVAANNNVYLASLEGVVTVLQAGGKGPEILHQVDFGERIAASPALSEEHLYLRTASSLYAFAE